MEGQLLYGGETVVPLGGVSHFFLWERDEYLRTRRWTGVVSLTVRGWLGM